MYLWVASQDCEGSRPALKTNSGAATLEGGEDEVCAVAAELLSRAPALEAGAELIGCRSAFPAAGGTATVALGVGTAAVARVVEGVGVVAPAAVVCAAAAKARASGLRAAGTEATGATEGFPDAPNFSAATFGIAAGRAGLDRETLSCPRHFFSSHSTQSMRPADTGKPQASHLRRLRNIGGT